MSGDRNRVDANFALLATALLFIPFLFFLLFCKGPLAAIRFFRCNFPLVFQRLCRFKCRDDCPC